MELRRKDCGQRVSLLLNLLNKKVTNYNLLILWVFPELRKGETLLVSEIPNIFLTRDQYCEELAHPHLSSLGKFQSVIWLMNYTQKCSSDPHYVFYAHHVLLGRNCRSQMNIVLTKVTTFNLTVGMIKQWANKDCFASDNVCKFMSTVKVTSVYWQHMISNVLAMIKQLVILLSLWLYRVPIFIWMN